MGGKWSEKKEVTWVGFWCVVGRSKKSAFWLLQITAFGLLLSYEVFFN